MKHTHIDECRIWICSDCDREQYELRYCGICLYHEGNPKCQHSPDNLIKSEREG
jgi:hypothetical protein